MNGAHYSQQHIALGRFIKKHYNQSSVTVPCFIDEKKQANEGGICVWKQAQWRETQHLALASRALE